MCGKGYAEALAEEMRQSDTWDYALCDALCREAGIQDKWDAAEGSNFESVVFEAADILGVEII